MTLLRIYPVWILNTLTSSTAMVCEEDLHLFVMECSRSFAPFARSFSSSGNSSLPPKGRRRDAVDGLRMVNNKQRIVLEIFCIQVWSAGCLPFTTSSKAPFGRWEFLMYLFLFILIFLQVKNLVKERKWIWHALSWKIFPGIDPYLTFFLPESKYESYLF